MFSPLHESARGLPKISDKECAGAECRACVEACPTEAIRLEANTDKPVLVLDRGSCINCSACIDLCPTSTLVSDLDTKTAALRREDLVLASNRPAAEQSKKNGAPSIFKRSVAARVVSTGCSACDQEIAATGNPIFDAERFGISVVASPRFADVLMVTGPVPKGMHHAVLSCYEQLSEPRRVMAVGSCAISGGVHKGGYTEANGLAAILPVDVCVPGCPPIPGASSTVSCLPWGEFEKAS